MFAHVPAVTAPNGADLLTIPLAVLVGGLGTLVLVTMLADRRGLMPPGAIPFGHWVALIAAGLSVGAASIHFGVIGAHFEEYPPYGVAFVALAWFQVGWGVAYLRAPERRLAITAIAVNTGALAVWLASRTVGLPIGPESGHLEPVGPLDIAAGLMEVALITVVAWDLGAIGRHLRPSLSRAGAVMVVGSSAIAVILLTTTAFAAAGGDPHGGSEPEVPPIGLLPTLALPSSEAAAKPTTTPSGLADSGGSGAGPLLGPAAGGSSAPSPPGAVASPSAAVLPTASPTGSASRSAEPTPSRATATPAATPRPTRAPTAPPPPAKPGEIRFGTSLGPDGDIAGSTSQFGEGQTAVWIGDLSVAPNTSTIRMFIVQILPDGREFEHWREDIPLADPGSRRLVGSAELSLYLHGGDGPHVMRYMRGDTLLAEGSFELVR